MSPEIILFRDLKVTLEFRGCSDKRSRYGIYGPNSFIIAEVSSYDQVLQAVEKREPSFRILYTYFHG